MEALAVLEQQARQAVDQAKDLKALDEVRVQYLGKKGLLTEQLKQNLEAHTAGSPVEPGQRWTNRSAGDLADELGEQGYRIDRKTLQRILKNELQLGRRQIAKKLPLGESADRDAQFQIMQKYRTEFLRQGFPVLSIDTKKKESLGNFYRRGPAWTDADVRAWDHDFPSYSWGNVIPFGVYDL
mgnify:CR=1 FL=1